MNCNGPLIRDECKIEEIDNGDHDGIKKNGIQLLDTVAENRKNFSTRDFERAKRARALCHNVGAPGIEKFKGMLRTNWTQDCPVVEKDMDIATKI